MPKKPHILAIMYFVRKLTILFLLSFFVVRAELLYAAPEAGGVQWVGWSDSLFEQATREGKLVLLDLEAGWCHWCHVMDAETYSNASVQKIIREKFIPVRVDQDSRPDLSARYRDYGWPATIVLSADGVDLAKRAGFIEAVELESLLKRLAQNPVPEKAAVRGQIEFPAGAELPQQTREELLKRYYDSEDLDSGGLKTRHRFLDLDTVEYAIRRAQSGQSRDEANARRTLHANLKLHDPVWGGVYQYSTHSGWDNPHYEKIMSSQVSNILAYSYAYAVWKEAIFGDAATRVYDYIRTFLRDPSGAFYTSQDSDVRRGEKATQYFALSDIERRKIGVPRVDTNMYARENGMVIQAIVALSAAKGDKHLLRDAESAASWAVAQRSLGEGGFRHAQVDVAGPYLGDTLEMGRAFLALYGATGERAWLVRARDAGLFIVKNFVTEGTPGFVTAAPQTAGKIAPERSLNENIQVGRFLNLLSAYLGDDKFKESAKSALRYVSAEKIALKSISEPGVLLLAEEISGAPLHITVVGSKSDQKAQALFDAGVSYPSTYKRLEWWDAAEGPLPNSDVQYPQLSRAAAFICTGKRCSLPIFAPEGVGKTIRQFEASAPK